MKTLLTFLMICFSFNTFAKTGIALVSALKGSPGQAFLFTPEGKVKNVKVGDFIENDDQLMVEVGSQLTFKYYNNNSYYHLNSGSQLKFHNKELNLVRGTLWVQAKDSKRSHGLFVTSANAFAEYDNTDFIFHYDLAEARTQVLVLNGEVSFGNILSPENSFNVLSGKVSQVDQKYQDGLPRQPEMIGNASFHQVISSFEGVHVTDEKAITSVIDGQDTQKMSRAIASVNESQTQKGKIIFIESKMNRLPASQAPSAMDYYLKTKKKKVKKVSSAKISHNIAPIKIYGAKSSRQIASVKPAERSVASEKERLLNDIDAAFVMSLKEESQTQKRHSPERLRLIRELESVSQQFQKEY